MKIKEGFELRDVCGEKVIVAQGIKNIDFTKIINLNESAAYLWNQASGREFTEEDLTDALLEQYEVEQAKAAADVKKLVENWRAEGLLED